MDIKSIIVKKRNRDVLNDDEIKYFVSKMTKGEITEAQIGALLSYIYTTGLTEQELVCLAQAMANSGDKIDLSDVADNIVDKHSTGGVGDKVTLILIPVIAALGIPVGKISSRGYGITGGTLDKLESIPGFNVNISIEDFKKQVKEVGASIIGQKLNLAPAETVMYRIRNQVACQDSLPIIAASLMSLKLATGANKIVFDITCGKGTYVKNLEEARRLGKLLIRLGKNLKKDVACIITDMDEPLGYSVGHNLEIEETINALNGKMPEDLGNVVVTLGTVILNLVNGKKNDEEHKEAIKEVLRNGAAYEKFKEIVKAQSGDLSYVENVDKFEKAKYIVPVYAEKDGTIESVDADIVGSIAIYIGAGRTKENNEVNHRSGITILKKKGDPVSTGETLAYIHSDDESKIKGATENLRDAFKITNKKVQFKSNILDILY